MNFKEFVYTRAVVEGVGMGIGGYFILSKNYEMAINYMMVFLVIHLVLDAITCKKALDENKL